MTRTLRKSLWMFSLVAILAACNSASPQDGRFRDALGLRGKTGAGKSLAQFKVELVKAERSGELLLRLAGTIPPDHYIYSLNDNGGAETRIDVKSLEGLEPLDDDFQSDHPPKPYDDPALERRVEKFYNQVTWTRRYRVTASTNLAQLRAAGQLVYQICDKSKCIPNNKVPFDVTLAYAGESANDQPARLVQEQADIPAAASDPEPGPGTVKLFTPFNGETAHPEPEFSARLRDGGNPNERLLEISVAIPAGYYIYATKNSGGPQTTITIDKIGGLEAIDDEFTPDHPPKVVPNDPETLKLDPEQPKTVNEYFDGVVWTRRYRVTVAADDGAPFVEGTIDYQICGGGVCRTLRSPFSTLVAVQPRAAAASPRSSVSPEPAHTATRTGGGLDKSQGLPLFLAAAIGAGFLALLTPCVFPMIPITVSFFQKQSEKQHHRPITMATVYCLGIVGTFTVLGLVMSVLFGPGALRLIANNSWVNLFIAGVLIFFGLNLLGMFEIRMPSWLLTYTATQEGRGGFLGVLFMALTFTLTSFTCVFAFVGGLLVAASQGDRLWPTLGLLAFSAAFSLPFFFLALFPSFLQKLPRSGGWMNIVKVVMGMVELGAAFKFLNTADLSWNGQALVFDYHVVMSAWVIISVATGLYLLNLFRLPHDVAVDHIGVSRFIWAMSFLGLASYLSVGLFGNEKPQGKVWQYIAAFAAPQFHLGTDPTGPFSKHGGLKYALDFERALEHAIAENKPLFLDFTGVNCTNCRYMEKGPMSRPEIEERLSRFVRVQLFMDTVPIADKTEAARLHEFNVRLQERWFGDVTLPSYVVIPPDRSVLDDPSKILDGFLGKGEEAAFAAFLDRSWSRWESVARRGSRALGQAMR
jgi:thiol:disulfide interchange protein DsbD